MPSESIAFMDQLRDQAIKDNVESSQDPFVSNGLDECENGNSLNKSLYHLQSLVYNTGTLPSNLLKSNEK